MNLKEIGNAMPDTRNDNSTAAERLIAAHDGDVALLYIYVRHTGSQDLEQAARDLCRTMQDIRAAREKLARMGLLPPEGEAVPAASPAPAAPTETDDTYLPPADELPSYTAQEISRMAEGSPAFRDICAEAARVRGKQLSSNELGILAGIYDYLALPPEVVFMLLHYCLEEARARHPGGRPGWRSIQREAFHWANLELLTLEQAEDYIRRQRDRGSAVGRVQELLGLSGRALTGPERKNINAWLDQGFEEAALQLAYERTVYNTGSLKWAYMNKILQRWHEAGLHTATEIEEKDSRRPRRSASAAPAAQGSAPVDLDRLKDLLNTI